MLYFLWGDRSLISVRPICCLVFYLFFLTCSSILGISSITSSIFFLHIIRRISGSLFLYISLIEWSNWCHLIILFLLFLYFLGHVGYLVVIIFYSHYKICLLLISFFFLYMPIISVYNFSVLYMIFAERIILFPKIY